MTKPLTDKTYLLEKIPGKGGWTFARIPEIPPDKHAHFGWVRVRGSIDGVEISKYHLMPMGDGHLFLPVKAEIRKKIKKQEGDYVHVILYADNDLYEVPEELLLCLNEEPAALRFFESLPTTEQQAYIEWVCKAKNDTQKTERLAECVNQLLKGKTFRQ